MSTADDAERYSVLADLFTAMEASHSVEDLAWLGAAAARRLLLAASASVSRFDAESGAVRTLVNVGDLGPGEQARPASEIYRVTDFPKLLQVAERQVPWSLDVLDESGDAAEIALLRELGKTSALGCPIVLGTRVWGELYLTRAGPVPFRPHERALAQMIAQAVAMCTGRLIGRDELRQLVYVDALTGLGNRRRADEALAEACALGIVVTVAIWDVDGLKVVNDRDGHLAGDLLLREVALLLSEAASRLPGAVATRLGGDEFCLIVRDRSGGDVMAALGDLVRRAGGLAAGAGVSSGVASSQCSTAEDSTPAPEMMDPRTLLRHADAALYRAKRAGGGRQVLSEEPSKPTVDTSENPARMTTG
jgi:diguanylate cyclase (GGDEF)-like protein